MKLDILIGSDNKCRLKVKDLTKESEYNTLFGVPFSRENSKTIDVLTYNKTTGEKTLTPIISDNTEDTVYLNIPEDGWVTLSHIILPSRKWIEQNEEHFKDKPAYIYIYCIDNDIVQRYFKGQFYDIELETLILQDNTYNTTISRVDKDYVSICFLKKCYINLCQQIFNGLCGLSNSRNKGCFSANIDKDLQTRRDIVWMGINVIKYMVQFNMLAEAQRIIELLESCNGICSGNPSITNKSSGCGCSKK